MAAQGAAPQGLATAMSTPERTEPEPSTGRREPKTVTLRAAGGRHGGADRDMPADRHAAARGITLGLFLAAILWAVILAALYFFVV
jgi:hypothetical protein